MKIRFEQLGWVAALGLGGVFVAAGFADGASKIGVVDSVSVYINSDLFKKNQDTIQNFENSRHTLLDFANLNLVFTATQAERFKVLSTKTDPLTGPEKTELDKIKSDVQAAAADFKTLQTKQNPTPADTQKLTDYNSEVKTMGETMQRWAQEFQDDEDAQKGKMRDDALEKVRAVVAQIGKTQGYTVIYSKDVVPYAANDVTADATKAMGKK